VSQEFQTNVASPLSRHSQLTDTYLQLCLAKRALSDGVNQPYWRVALIVVTDAPELVGLLPVA
jgi:hypothetical protein